MRNWLAASSNARDPQRVPAVLEPRQQGAVLETNAIFGFVDVQATGQQQSRPTIRDFGGALPHSRSVELTPAFLLPKIAAIPQK